MRELIYISYSETDLEFVQRLSGDLEAHEFKVWYKDKDISPGDLILTEINNAFKKVRCVIIVLSNYSTGSNWAAFERDTILMASINSSDKKPIPLLLSDCDKPKLLENIQHADFRPNSNYQDALNNLLKGLKKNIIERKPNNPILQEPYTSEIHSYLVRFIIFVLTRSETERHDTMITLEIDSHILGLLLRGNSIKRVNQKIITHLPQLAVRNKIFHTTKDARNFISVKDGTLNELRSKLSLIIKFSDEGKKLITLLKDYILRMKMTQQWSYIVGQYSLILSGQDNPDEALKAMHRIYFKAAVTWSRSQMRQFVKSDFEKSLWTHIIDSAQDQVPENKLTHLHHANVFLGEQLGEFFSKERIYNKNYGSVRKYFNILECGVGGANTTHQVLQCIIEKCEKIEPYEVIQYKGFEVNEAFADQADNILKGKYNVDNILQEKDARSEFFNSLNKNSNQRFRPLFSNIETFGKSWTNKFVENVDMSDGIASLAMNLESKQGDIDLFLCSYALHHVPNGHDLRTYIFGDYDDPLDRLDLRTKEGEYFCEYIQYALKLFLRTGSISPESNVEFKSPYARALIELIQLEDKYPWQIEELLKDFQLYIKNNTTIKGVFINSSWSNAMVDYQEKLLSEVYRLLRPGGYLAIADPDGYSKYNKENLPKNAEMGVAHFLSRSQLVTLLKKLKFTIVNRWTQRKLEQEHAYEAVSESDSNHRSHRQIKGIEDPNRGYIVIAKKPVN